MSLFRRGNKVKVLKIIPGTSNLELKSMVLRDNMLHDRLEDSKYTVSARPVQLEERGQKQTCMQWTRNAAVLWTWTYSGMKTLTLRSGNPSGRIQMSIKTNPALMCDITQEQFFRRPSGSSQKPGSCWQPSSWSSLQVLLWLNVLRWFWWQMKLQKN